MVICGGIALFSVGMIYYKYTSDKENGFATNKPYKEYYTVYRLVYNLLPPASMINFVFSRPDDPRIQKLRQEWYKNGAPPMTSVKLD